jgi:hypothetical protein
MGRRLSRCLVMVRVVSSEDLALTAVLAMVVMACGPPPSSSLTREALTHRVDDVSSGGYGS